VKAFHALVLVCCAVAACVYDPDKPCGPNQVQNAEGYCVCLPGWIVEGGKGCVQCGANEQVVSNKCACVAGHMRATPAGPCTVVPMGLNTACRPASPQCPSATYAHCQPSAVGEGYCTSTGCAASAECPMGYSCRGPSGGRYCARPPVGQGKDCMRDTDCETGEAKICDPMFLKMCLVADCSVTDPEACHDGWRCCDLAPYGLKRTFCLPLSQLPNMACP
jgi:hypothetical protein